MNKINVIKESCIGCGACVAIDPDHFDFDEEGKSNVINNENLEDENLIMAIESCPTSAIEIIDILEDNNDNKDSFIEENSECCCKHNNNECPCNNGNNECNCNHNHDNKECNYSQQSEHCNHEEN